MEDFCYRKARNGEWYPRRWFLHSGPTPRGRDDPEDLVSAAHAGYVTKVDKNKSSGLGIILRNCYTISPFSVL